MQDARVPVGPLDFDALATIRDVFNEEGLVSEIEWDDSINPQTLQIHIDDGIQGQYAGRFDVKWTTKGYYSFHYSQHKMDFRFDHHPKPDTPGIPDIHFHPPPSADTAVSSCIDVTSVELVARAVHKCWRRAYDQDDPSKINTLSNPP